MGTTGVLATISLLAVSGDREGTLTPGRARAKRACSAVARALAPFVPGGIGRYDEDWNPRAFGDNVTAWGTPVVLIESGGVPPGRALTDLAWTLVSTGGTAWTLSRAGCEVVEVCDHTGFPEILDGRVKTLHPRIHAGLLARQDEPTHVASLPAHGILPFHLVAVNLYPFQATVATPGVTDEDAIENIDVGGPSMLRAAAKNYDAVESR